MKYILLLITIILTTLVVGNMFWWIKTATSIEGFDNVLKEYLSIFPSFIKDGRIVAFLRLFVAGLAIASSIFMISKRYFKIVSVLLLSINGLIFAWTLFSLM